MHREVGMRVRALWVLSGMFALLWWVSPWPVNVGTGIAFGFSVVSAWKQSA